MTKWKDLKLAQEMKTNKEPTRECCEKCTDNLLWEKNFPCTCPCHSIKPLESALSKGLKIFEESLNESTPDSNDWEAELDELCTGKSGNMTWAIDNTEIKKWVKSQKDKSKADTLTTLKERMEKMRWERDESGTQPTYNTIVEIRNNTLDDILKEI